MCFNQFTSDEFTREELNLHNKLSKKGCKQQNRALQLHIVIEKVSKLIESARMPNRSMGAGISNNKQCHDISFQTWNIFAPNVGSKNSFLHIYSYGPIITLEHEIILVHRFQQAKLLMLHRAPWFAGLVLCNQVEAISIQN